MRIRVWFARPSSLVDTLGVAMAVTLATALLGALRVVARYGDWLYPEWSARLAVLGFAAAAGAALGLVGGLFLWLALRALDPIQRGIGRRGLGVAVAVALVVGFLNVLRGQGFYAQPLYVGALGLALLLAGALARGSHPWRRGAVLALLVAATGLGVAAVWLNLVVLLGSPTSSGNLANAALWGAGLLLAALGVAAGSRLVAAPEQPISRMARAVVAATAVLSLGALAPLYQIARAVSEPPATAPTTFPARVPAAAAPDAAPLQGIVLISIDTLRADHMGIYGYPRTTTPHIDRFFTDGAVFTQMFAQSPWTLPAHASLFTGQYPSTHGVRFGPAQTVGSYDRIPDEALTLAEILRDAGYATAAFTGGSYVSRSYAFDQGFDTFESPPSGRMGAVVDLALPWLRRHSGRPFFLFLHSFDVHTYLPGRIYHDLSDGGYDGPLRGRMDLATRAGPDRLGPLSDADVAYLVHLYDNALRGTDDTLARLFRALDDLGARRRTAVLLTSDHGEEFAEHGRTGHSFSLAEALLRVPLLVSAHGLGGARRIAEPAQTIDIAPTILALTGVPVPAAARMQGVSLVPALLGQPHETGPLVAEADALDRQAALVADGYKYMHHGVPSHNLLELRFLPLTLRALLTPTRGPELYDLEADPAERDNLVARDPERAAAYHARLMANLERLRGQRLARDAADRGILTPEHEAELRALGYLD